MLLYHLLEATGMDWGRRGSFVCTCNSSHIVRGNVEPCNTGEKTFQASEQAKINSWALESFEALSLFLFFMTATERKSSITHRAILCSGRVTHKDEGPYKAPQKPLCTWKKLVGQNAIHYFRQGGGPPGHQGGSGEHSSTGPLPPVYVSAFFVRPHHL